jgi:hypothetical protein
LPLVAYATYYTNLFAKITTLEVTNAANITKVIVTKAVIAVTKEKEEKEEKKKENKKGDKRYKV